MVDVQLFKFEDIEVRVVMLGDEPWWVAADLARALGYRDGPAATRTLDADQLRTHSMCMGDVRRLVSLVSESGLYRLVMRSDRAQAKAFQNWVTRDVLPRIRQTGKFSAVPEPVEVPMPALPRTFSEALRALADQVDATTAAVARVVELEPPARAWDSFAGTGRDYSMADAAKFLSRDPAINLGRQKLFAKLVELGMVFVEYEGTHGTRKAYKPKQVHVDAGRLSLRMGGRWQHPETLEWEAGTPQLRVTAKGLAYLLKKLGGIKPLDLSPDARESIAIPEVVQ